MKTFIAILATSLMSLSGYAYFDQTRLTISSTSNSPIRIMVDGKKYSNNNNDVTITSLAAGYHSIKIFLQQRQKGCERDWWATDNHREGGSQTNFKLVYNNGIYVRPQFHVDITINRFGKAFVDEQPISGNDDGEEDWNEDGNNRGGYNQSMNAQVFEQFKQSLRKDFFDEKKLSSAKTVIGVNWFTSSQVKEIVQLFTFENNKLEIAKYAYKYTVDKGNYFLINDVFTFNSNKEELLRYIQTVK